jgi:GYF domain 2
MTSPTSGSNIEWYLARDGRQHGPLAETEMTKFLELGHLRPGDLVWRSGFAEWRPASDVFDLTEKTLINGRRTQPATQPAAPAAVKAAETGAGSAAKPAASTTTALSAEAMPEAAVSAPTEAVAADTGAKTGLSAKKPLDTPLLITPAQLAPAPAARTQPTPGTDTEPAASPVTSLNERLQRAASERVVAGTPAPVPQSMPRPVPTPATAAPSPAAATPRAPQSGPAKMQPLPELRAPNPVPLMPLEPRTGAAPSDGAVKRKKRQRSAAPEVGGNAPSNRGRSMGIGLTLAIILGGGGWLAYASRDAIKSTIGMATQANTGANPGAAAKRESAAAPAAQAKIASATTAPEPSGKAAPFVTAAKTAETVDADLKRSALWQLIAREFPEWHRDRVAEIAKLAADKRDAAAISKHIAEAIVSLRRKFADQALSASPERLRGVAAAFLDNLRQLSAQSTDACYGFISQGETYPAVIDLMRQGDKTDALHKQAIAVFEAVSEGRKSPLTSVPPRKGDYDTLAAELTARGWSQSDLQMFSDARALAAAQPEQVCKMVQDWFAAQIAIKDPAVQLRLLIESLRPVVAG